MSRDVDSGQWSDSRVFWEAIMFCVNEAVKSDMTESATNAQGRSET